MKHKPILVTCALLMILMVAIGLAVRSDPKDIPDEGYAVANFSIQKLHVERHCFFLLTYELKRYFPVIPSGFSAKKFSAPEACAGEENRSVYIAQFFIVDHGPIHFLDALKVLKRRGCKPADWTYFIPLIEKRSELDEGIDFVFLNPDFKSKDDVAPIFSIDEGELELKYGRYGAGWDYPATAYVVVCEE